MPTIKVIELMGVSDKSWEDAAAQALAEASKTIHNISGLDVQDRTAKVDNGKISEYHTTVRLAFKIDGSDSTSTAKASRSRSSSRSGSTKKPAAKRSAAKKSAAKTAPRRSRR